MKKIIKYSAQYKIISHSFAEQLHNQNQNHGKNTTQKCIRKHYQKIGKNL